MCRLGVEQFLVTDFFFWTSTGVSFLVALSRVRLGAFCSEVFCWSLGSFICILPVVYAYWA